MKNIKNAIILMAIIVVLIRLTIAGLLIVASYELDTPALRLLSISSGLWLILMAIRKTVLFYKGFKIMLAQSE